MDFIYFEDALINTKDLVFASICGASITGYCSEMLYNICIEDKKGENIHYLPKPYSYDEATAKLKELQYILNEMRK